MLFDSHAHLNFQAFGEDLDEVIKRCLKHKMLVLNVGSQVPTSKKAINIAENNPGLFASVGIHPIHIWGDNLDPIEAAGQEDMGKENPAEAFLEIAKLAKNSKVVAIGETGLDYFRMIGDKQKGISLQKEYFVKHLDLANNLDKPLIIHGRPGEGDDVYRDILEILEGKKVLPFSERKGVIHCFISNLEIAQRFIKLGFAIGFTGIITFTKKAEEIQEVVKALPLENILIETDCPWLTPEPFRGQRNEPIHVERVAKKIAELKGIDVKEVVEKTARNAMDIFKIIA